MILVSKFMVHRAISDKTFLSLGLLSPLKEFVLDLALTNILPLTFCPHNVYFLQLLPRILLSFLRYNLCLMNLGINTNKILRLGDLFGIGKQPVISCKIGKIKSLAAFAQVL